MHNIKFGKAKLEDVLRISVLLKTVYIQAYADDGITFEFANFITKRFSVEHIEKIISETPNQLIIAYQNDNPIGAAELIYKKNCPLRNRIIPELSKFYVLDKFHGKGIGFGLMKEVEAELLISGFKEFWLEVYVKNKEAISFYERQGFTSLGSVNCPMETNNYENLVMNKVL